MGAIMSYINQIETRKSRWESKDRKCPVCATTIDPDTTMFQLWCEYCDTVWCNNCWKKDINGITKMAYECCGKCSKEDLNATKSILYDLVTMEQDVNLEHICDKYNLKDMFIRSKQKYEEELNDLMYLD